MSSGEAVVGQEALRFIGMAESANMPLQIRLRIVWFRRVPWQRLARALARVLEFRCLVDGLKPEYRRTKFTSSACQHSAHYSTLWKRVVLISTLGQRREN